MYDAQSETISSRIDTIETSLAWLYDSGHGSSDLVCRLEAELAALERRLDRIELAASYEPLLTCEEA